MDKYAPKEETIKRLNNTFQYHAPKEDQAERYEKIRDAAKEFAFLLVSNCPESRELSLALTHLEEAVMEANSAIARNE